MSRRHVLARWGKTLAALSVVMGFASCARHYQLSVPADVKELPVRRGWNGINVVAVTPWRYMGSKYQTHEFRYHFNRDNALKFRDVSVARDRTILHFEEKPYKRTREWVTLASDGEMFYFSLVPRR